MVGDDLCVAIAQVTSKNRDIQSNINKAEKIIRNLDEHVDIVIFPEKYVTGYDLDFVRGNPKKNTISADDPRLTKIREACVNKEVTAIIGAPTFRENTYYISDIIISNIGGYVSFYDKIHLFENELSFYTPGKEQSVVKINNWNIGLAICNDVSNPSHAEKYKKNIDIYMASCLFGEGNGEREIKEWFPQRAIDNNCYTLLSNSVGRSGRWDACGLSGVWNFEGAFLTKQEYKDEVIIIETLKKSDQNR